MKREENSQVGRRDFIRSATILGTGVGVSALVGACSDSGEPLTSPSQSLVSGRIWVHVDSFDVNTGTYTSIDSYSDTTGSEIGSDVPWTGRTISASGEILPYSRTVDENDASSLSLVSVSDGHYRMQKGGVPQPPAAPYDIYLTESSISGTDVIVVLGYLIDPGTENRVTFTIISNDADSAVGAASYMGPNSVIGRAVARWIRKNWRWIVWGIYEAWNEFWNDHDQGGGGP